MGASSFWPPISVQTISTRAVGPRLLDRRLGHHVGPPGPDGAAVLRDVDAAVGAQHARVRAAAAVGVEVHAALGRPRGDAARVRLDEHDAPVGQDVGPFGVAEAVGEVLHGSLHDGAPFGTGVRRRRPPHAGVALQGARGGGQRLDVGEAGHVERRPTARRRRPRRGGRATSKTSGISVQYRTTAFPSAANRAGCRRSRPC